MNRTAVWYFLLGASALLACLGSVDPACGQEAVSPPFTTISRSYPGEAQALFGAGGTFPVALYKRWFEAYAGAIGVHVDYAAVGSGEGINRIINRTVDFAGSDAPMTDAQLRAAKGGDIVHIPTAFGAIALIYNVPGIAGQLRFTPQNIADIYLGQLTRWNDSRLVSANPQLARVSQEIIVVHRADGSGSTYGLTDFLSGVNPAWIARSGQGTSVTWPVGIGSKGGDGMVNEVKANPYSIGYVDLGSAIEHQVAYAQIKNGAGSFVAPSLASIGAAVAASATRGQRDLRFSVVNAPGANSYPICTGTWLLAYRKMMDRSKAIALTRLLWWATHDGQAINASLTYAPVPRNLQSLSEVLISQITVNGQAAFPGR